jgi:hypothetical protein
MGDFIQDAQGWYIVVAPGEFRDYSLDWTDFLAGLPAVPGMSPLDQIARSTWSVPAPNVASSPATNIPTNVTTTWISSPTIGTYFILNTIYTVGGRIEPRGFRLIVTENI